MYLLNGQEHKITYKFTTVYTLLTIYVHLWKGLEITLKELKPYQAEMHIS